LVANLHLEENVNQMGLGQEFQSGRTDRQCSQCLLAAVASSQSCCPWEKLWTVSSQNC